MAKGPIEKLRSMADSNRLGRTASDLLVDLDADGVRALASVLEELAGAIEEASAAIESIEDAEGQEERAEAREEALGKFEELANFAEYDLGEVECPSWIIEELTTKREGA